MASLPLKILHLASHESVRRGGAIQMLRLAQGLAERGHSVTAAFNVNAEHLQDDPAIQRASAAGVNVIGIPLEATAASAGKLVNLWRTGRFDVLHVHREPALEAAAAALEHETIPCFVVQRGTIYLPQFLGATHRLLFSRRVHRVIAVAHAVKRALVWRRGIPPGKIEVVYGGVESNLFHPGPARTDLRAQHGIPSDVPIITLPGALIEKKGPKYFLQAAALMRKQSANAHFWMVGSGKLEKELRGLADDLKLGASAQFLGHVGNMPDVYAASDLVVCASIKGEGLSGTLREALAMARPVVTTNCAGNTELVEEGKTGYVCKMANPPSLADAIQRALGNPSHAQSLAQAGRERVLAWCSESVRSEKMEQIYFKILANSAHQRCA